MKLPAANRAPGVAAFRHISPIWNPWSRPQNCIDTFHIPRN